MTVTHQCFVCFHTILMCVCLGWGVSLPSEWSPRECLPHQTLLTLWWFTAVPELGFFIIIIIINSLAFMHDPVIWIKIQKEILTKMIGEWSQTTVVAARLLPGMEPYSRCCPDFIFVESWEQPMILEWNKGWLFFHKQLPSRFIFKNRRIKIVMVFATLNIEVHSNWD